MALPKLFQRIFWHNNTTPAINEDNLNAMSKGLSDVDDRLISLAGTIQEDVVEIQADMEILNAALETIDDSVASAQGSASTASAKAIIASNKALVAEGFAVGEQNGTEVGQDSDYYQNNAKYYANIANPPIRVLKDYAPIISITDAINKKARDVKIKLEPVQDLHGYTNPWPGGCGKNLLPNNMTSSGIITVNDDGSIKINGTTTSEDERSIFDGTLLSGPESYIASANFPSYDSEIYMGIRITNASSQNRYVGVRTSDVAIELASGEYISRVYLHIGANKTVNNVTIYPMIRLASVADGTYEPYSNICPITGYSQLQLTRAIKNLYVGSPSFDGYSQLNYWTKQTETYNGHEVYKRSGAWSGAYKTIYLKPGTYTFSASVKTSDGGNIAIYCYFSNVSTADIINGQRTHIQSSTEWAKYSCTFTVTKGGTVAPRIEKESSGDIYISEYQLEIGESVTDYEPFQGNIYIIQLNGMYYGARYDATSGEFIVYWIASTINNLNLTYGGIYFYGTISDKAPGITNIISSCYATVNTGASDMPSGSIKGNGGNANIYIMDKRFTNVSDLKADVGSEIVVYELATPQVLSKTALALELFFGNNTLYANSGDVALEYDASGIIHIAEAKLDTETLKTIAAASSDFADFKARIAAL